MSTDQTITVTVKPEIDREAVEEAAQMAAALFLSSFAVAVLEGIAAEEPPEAVLERVKAETLEKAAQEDEPSEAELTDWERELIEQSTDPAWNPRNAQGYDLLRSALNAASIDAKASTADYHLVAMLLETSQGIEVLRRLDRMSPPVVTPLTQDPAQDGENAPLADAEHDQAPVDPRPATDAPEPTQTLADLKPCLGDRVRAQRTRHGAIEDFTYGHHPIGGYGWSTWLGQSVVMEAWTVLEHLDPVTPEEPPVGAGILVDAEGDLWRLGKNGWHCRHHGGAWWAFGVHWSITLGEGPFHPATPADLAEHGVDEQGEPVGKGEAVEQDAITIPDVVGYKVRAVAAEDLLNRAAAIEAEAGER